MSSSVLRISVISKKDNSLEFSLRPYLEASSTNPVIVESDILKFKNTQIQFKYVAPHYEGDFDRGTVFVKAKDATNRKIILVGPIISTVNFLPTDNVWIEISNREQAYSKMNFFLIEYVEDVTEFPFQPLLEDDDLCDFVLLANSGGDDEVTVSIRVHKAVLAASSPVLRRMMCSDFKEKSQGYVEVPADLAALQAFKQYMYTRTLPSDIKLLEQLVRFGSYYMMPELEKGAIQALADAATEQNAYDILEFAFENKAKKLSMAIFQRMGSTIDLNKMDVDKE